MISILLLALTIGGKPLAPISYPACLTDKPDEADFMAREVSNVQDARWCVTWARDCKDAVLLIYRHAGAKETYVVSETCKK